MNFKLALAIAMLPFPPLCAAENVGAEMATAMTQEIKQQEEARNAQMESYWDAQPEAPAVIPGQFLAKLKTLPWPDPRPVAKEKYFTRPEVKARELKGEDADPLLAGLSKKEKSVKNELQAAQRESDEERYALWKRNVVFFQQGIESSASGAIAGQERVSLLEAALVFVKEGVPRYYLHDTVNEDTAILAQISNRAQALIANLYKQGQYVPDYKSMLWAERIGNHLAGGITPVSEREKRDYHKIIARLRAFDPRATQAEAKDGETLAAAPAAAAADPAMEQFLQGLVSQCNKTIAGLNVAAAVPSQYTEIGNKAEQAIRNMLASFPSNWQNYPRAKWAHGWFADALEKSAGISVPADRGMALFKALDKYEAGLKAGL